MKLAYNGIAFNEAGTALPGCGTIHKTEVKTTLDKLADDLEWPNDLNNCVVGSTGKKEFSGDIDLVIDTKVWSHGVLKFRENLNVAVGADNVARNGDLLSIRYPIIGYNNRREGSSPRTGYVQIDFNFGDLEWERVYHFSPGDESAYKGAHRNLAIAAICSSVNLENSYEVDTYDRPVKQTRWKFGSNGFIRVIRIGTKDPRTGTWMKKRIDTIIDGPYTDPVIISKSLFPEDGTPADLNSLETIMEAVKRNYGMVDQERIWRRCAETFASWRDGKYFEYPPEISRYFILDDK